MPRHNAYRSRGVESVGNELSSGQLGIGIAVAVIFGLVCFILGYVVANVEQPLNNEVLAIAGEGAGPKPNAPKGAGTSTPSGTTKAPAQTPAPAATDTAGGSPAPVASAPTAPSGPSSNPSQRNPAGRTGVEALPTPGGPIPMVKRPINLGAAEEITPAADTGGNSAGTTPAEPPPIVPPTETKPVVAEEAPTTVASNTGGAPAAVESAPAPTTTPAPVTKPPEAKPPAPKTPTVSRGSYGVQVAAFNGPRRSEQATEARKRLKEATGLDAEIIKTADGTYEKVIITGFSTPEAAKAQCEKLKEKAGYASSWVVPVR